MVIEHNMEFVMSLCTRMLVLAEGRVLAEGAPDGDPRQSGRHRSLSWPLGRADVDAILEVENVVAGYGEMTILNGASFKTPRGAITTVIGPNGAGKSTVFKAIFGLLQVARRPRRLRRRATSPERRSAG